MAEEPPLSRLIHELKSPLTAVKGLAATGASLYDEMSDEDRRRFYVLIDGEADRLRRVLDQVADILRIQAGSLQPVVQELDLPLLIEEAISKCDLGDHPLQVSVEPGLHALGDARWVERCLVEVLGNAGRFSSPETPVELTAESEADRAVIRVRDHGPGLAPEQLERAFDLCTQVRPAGFTEVPGAGLSLHLAREHLSLIRGTIRLMPASGNGGTICCLELPRGGQA